VTAEALALAELALFDGCTTSDLERLSSAVTGVRRLPEGTVLCREGEKADRWWVVEDGLAEVTVGGLYVATIGPGESIGELALLDGQARNATVTAGSDMVLHEVDGALFLDLLAEHPKVTLAFLREVAVRLRATTEQTARPPAPSSPPAAVVVPRRTVPGESVTFNPFAPGYFSNPYAQYADLRDSSPLYLDRLSNAYLVTRYADVHRLSRDRSLTVGTARAASTPVIEAEIARDNSGGGVSHRMMLRRDGDDHSRLRALLARAFTPKAISAWRDRTEVVVGAVLSDLSELESIDVIADFAAVLPAMIISEMLGIPEDDTEQLSSWSQAMTKTLDPLNTPREEAESVEATKKMAEYIAAVVADKEVNGSADILTALIEAEVAGDRLTREELVAQVMLLYMAGFENALNLVGNGLVHLFEFPDQLDRMRTDPSLDANAIEELIRFDSPVQFTRRVCTESLEIGEVTAPPGSLLYLGLGAANRDPEQWGAGAELLDLARPRANEHASFGGGPHHCLGSSLARLEAKVALPQLVRRFPRMEPAYGAPAWSARMIVRGVERLPVRLHG
jgi:cytochrome P450